MLRILKKVTIAMIVLVITALLFLAIVSQFRCGYSGGSEGAPYHIGHCDCFGHKVIHSPSPTRVLDAGEEQYCLGYVRERWEEVGGVTILFDVEPSSASVSIAGTSYFGAPGKISPNGQLTIDRIGEIHTMNEVPYRVNNIVTHRDYEIRNGKIIFHDKTPIRIEVTNPGYKPWRADLIPEKDPMEIKVKLEHE